MTQQLDEEKPYPLRRSSGRIQVVPYDPANESMAHDFDYVTEAGVAPANSSLLAINLVGEAKLAIFGELGGGYLFEAPSSVEFTGSLHIAFWTEDGLAEAALGVGAVIEVVTGTAKLFVCDLKHFVLMYDGASKYTVGLLTGEGVQASQAADVLNRIANSAKAGPTAGGGPRRRGGKKAGARNSAAIKKKVTAADADEANELSATTTTVAIKSRSKTTLKVAISALSGAKKRSEAVLDTIIAHHLASSKSTATSSSKVEELTEMAEVELVDQDDGGSQTEDGKK